MEDVSSADGCPGQGAIGGDDPNRPPQMGEPLGRCRCVNVGHIHACRPATASQDWPLISYRIDSTGNARCGWFGRSSPTIDTAKIPWKKSVSSFSRFWMMG